MKIKLIQSSVGSGDSHRFLASYVINDVVALDAGCIGFIAPVEDQKQIEHVIISHTHIDHIASLPIFVDNVFVPGPDCVTIYGNESVLECLRGDVFNDRVWPDMIRLSEEESPFLRLRLIESEQSIEIENLRITPIEVNHIVPTLGFLIEDSKGAIVFVSDTSPTEQIWEVANRTPNLKAAFLEASFPNSMDWLAEKAGHLTPAMFHNEIGKLNHDVDIIAVHIKPLYEKVIVAELQALGLPKLRMGTPGQIYDF